MSLRPSAKTEVRRNRYKVAVDAEEGRRRREDHMVEIRKNKREENLQKKRREGFSAAAQTGQDLPSAKKVCASCVRDSLLISDHFDQSDRIRFN